MNILSWNLQGLGNPWTVRALKHFLKVQNPDIGFLMETRLKANEIDGLRLSFQNFNFFVVDSTGRSGGLILMWKKQINIYVSSFSSHHIDFSLLNEAGIELWRGCGIYVWPEAGNKFKTWDFLSNLQ